MTSSRLEPSKTNGASCSFELVCFRIVVFPLMKAVSYTSGPRRDKVVVRGLEAGGK